METNQKIIAYTDGGSRGNPGPAALGVVIQDVHGTVLKAYGEALGVKTNNEAEYAAVVSALKKIRQTFGKEKAKKMSVEVRMDSELVMRQLTGVYRIETEHLFPFFMAIWNLRLDFDEVLFTHVPREKNKDADRMVNETLDKEQKQLW